MSERLAALADALRRDAPSMADAALEPMPDTGLAHWHVRLVGRGVVARLPKQSQMGLDARANLDYQAACFERASAGGHAPRLIGRLAPHRALPRGGLLVEEVVGRPLRLPHDLPALADALASWHALPLPPADARAPLVDPPDPLQAMADEVAAQALHLDAAALDPRVQILIGQHLQRFAQQVAALHGRADGADGADEADGAPGACPKRLIAFDAHPGNFLVRTDGRAVLVDLEKARYGAPPLDLAHATLYTSTTWDRASHAVLSPGQVIEATRRWLGALGPLAPLLRPWIVPLREAMWLWAVTWCAKWRVLSAQAARGQADGEDWSAAHSDAALVAHVRGRVDHYLDPTVVEQQRREFAALEDALG